MPRILIALFCAATLALCTPIEAEEPGEGLIDGLLAQIRQLEHRLERIEAQVDKNSAAIDRHAAQPQEEKKPQAAAVAKPKQVEQQIALDWTPKTAIDYSGAWLMTLPQGAEHQVVIKNVEDEQFKIIRSRLNLAGIYQANGATLTIVQPDNKRLLGFVWTAINRNTLILTGEPPLGRTGSSYVGATLTRLVESPE